MPFAEGLHRLKRVTAPWIAFFSLTLGAAALTACSGGGESSGSSSSSTTASASTSPGDSASAEASEAQALPVATEGVRPDELIRQYLRQPVLDQFNESVTDENRGTETPKRGGVLRVRSPADLAELNPLTVSGQPEREFLNLLTDPIVNQDPTNLEWYPMLAWSWSDADLLQMAGGEVLEGVLVEVGDEEDPSSEVVFVPGAKRRFFGKYDVAQVADDMSSVTLTEARGGETIAGTVTERPYVFEVNESTNPELAADTITTTIGDLATWRDQEGTPRDRPFRKQVCSFYFHIRDGVTWHDGRPFSAEDIKFTYDTLMNTNIQDAAPLRSLVEPYLTSCEVLPDGKTVHILAHKPYFQLFSAMMTALPPVPKHVFNPEQFGGDEKAFADAFQTHQFREQPILMGPYRLAEWKKSDSLLAVRYDNYWASQLPEGAVAKWSPEQPYLDAVRTIIIGEKSVSLKELQKQSLDVDRDIEADIWFNDATNSDLFNSQYVRANFLGFGYTYVGYNHQREIFQDKETREALAMLIPRDRIIQDIHRGMHMACSGPFYYDGPGYDHSIEPTPYDPREARRLLRRAGWLDRDGDGILEKEIDGEFVPFEFEYLIHNARDYHQKVADIVKESVEQVGIEMTIRKLDWSVYSDETRKKNFDAVRFAWGAAVEPDPYTIWHSSQVKEGGNNFISYVNPRIDEICETIREEFDPLKRWELAREMHRILHEEQPVTFLFAFTEQVFYPRGIQGVLLYPSAYPVDYREWWWADEKRRNEQVNIASAGN